MAVWYCGVFIFFMPTLLHLISQTNTHTLTHTQTSLVAVVVPNMEEIVPWGAANRLQGSAKQLAETAEYKTALMADIVVSCVCVCVKTI